MPASARNSVDFPAPFGPITPTSCSWARAEGNAAQQLLAVNAVRCILRDESRFLSVGHRHVLLFHCFTGACHCYSARLNEAAAGVVKSCGQSSLAKSSAPLIFQYDNVVKCLLSTT